MYSKLPKDPAHRPTEFYQTAIVAEYSRRMGWIHDRMDYSTLFMSEPEAVLLQLLIDLQAKLASEGVKATAAQVFDTLFEIQRQERRTMFSEEEIAAAIRSRIAGEDKYEGRFDHVLVVEDRLNVLRGKVSLITASYLPNTGEYAAHIERAEQRGDILCYVSNDVLSYPFRPEEGYDPMQSTLANDLLPQMEALMATKKCPAIAVKFQRADLN
jgi:hypothetical protein